jgi:solute carrier family 25 2-oxodicarboxylate transporter 21
MSQGISILTGAAAGATEAVVIVPFELVKIRLQDRAQAHKYSGVLSCVVTVVKEEGPLALYQGLESTVWRHVVWNAGYFGCIFQVRGLLPFATTKSQRMKNDLIAGCAGGTLGTVLNTPLDVVKTRIQSSPGVAGSVAKYVNVLPSLKMIYMEEGFRALYKGFVPKLVRFCPGGGVLLVAYSQTLEFLMGMRMNPLVQ